MTIALASRLRRDCASAATVACPIGPHATAGGGAGDEGEGERGEDEKSRRCPCVQHGRTRGCDEKADHSKGGGQGERARHCEREGGGVRKRKNAREKTERSSACKQYRGTQLYSRGQLVLLSKRKRRCNTSTSSCSERREGERAKGRGEERKEPILFLSFTFFAVFLPSNHLIAHTLCLACSLYTHLFLRSLFLLFSERSHSQHLSPLQSSHSVHLTFSVALCPLPPPAETLTRLSLPWRTTSSTARLAAATPAAALRTKGDAR